MRVLVVGGNAGGASAAARLRRLDENAEIVVYEKGDYISFANCGLPYHVGGVIPDRAQLLVQTPQSMKERFNIDFLTGHEVTAVDRQAHTVTVRDLATGTETVDHYDKLVLAPGGSPVRPPIPGIDSKGITTLWTIPDMDRIVAAVQNGARRAASWVVASSAWKLRRICANRSWTWRSSRCFPRSCPFWTRTWRHMPIRSC